MAATSIVRLSLESAQYEQRMRSAKRQFEDFTKSIGINMKQLTAAGLAIGAATAAINTFTSACSEAIARSTELAKEGEGIKRAFDRLNQPNLLDNLRQATHNTVSDLELMKNAVKFDNFNLSLDQMGTFLAFAQQQAKDTGQSVEYMVDSIVTGLGRKSLPILDNLGLSATDIRERMKETGDMTQAVAAIIKERMEAAGGYVETAADRAAQSEAALQNAMEQLGQTLLPLEEEGKDMFNALEVGAINLLNNALTPLVPKVIELKNNITSLYDYIINNPVSTATWDWLTTGLKIATHVIPILNSMRKTIADLKKEAGMNLAESVNVGGLGSLFSQKGGGKTPSPSFTTPTASGGSHASKSSLNIGFDPNRAALAGEMAEDTMPSVWAMIGEQGRKQLIGGAAKQFDLGRDISKKGTTNLDEKKNDANLQDITSTVGSMLGSLENLGIEIPKGFAQVFGVLQTITTIVTGIQALQQVGTFLGLFANGGVAHAANGLVPGSRYSGDRVPALLNSGETVLTRAQSSNLVSMLNNNGIGNLQLETYLSGEDIRFVINNNGRRTGVGEMVTSKVRRI